MLTYETLGRIHVGEKAGLFFLVRPTPFGSTHRVIVRGERTITPVVTWLQPVAARSEQPCTKVPSSPL